MSTTGWPEFDLTGDAVFEGTIKPFIENELRQLKAYDERRLALNPDINYIFHEHAARVANDIRNTCAWMGLSKNVQDNMYWAMLCHDIGKRTLEPVDIWDTQGKPTKELSEYRRGHTRHGVNLVYQSPILGGIHHPFIDLMKDIMMNHHERMDGLGINALKAEEISMPVRLACIVEDFDGRSIRRSGPEWQARDLSPPTVLERMRSEPDKGAKMFDMALFEIFAAMKMEEHARLSQRADPAASPGHTV